MTLANGGPSKWRAPEWRAVTKLEVFFELDNKGTITGRQLKLKKKHCNTDLRQHFFSERVINSSSTTASSGRASPPGLAVSGRYRRANLDI